MFSAIKKAIEDWKQERIDNEFRAGFEWAMGQYYIGKTSLDEIAEVIKAVPPNQGPFDEGAEEALGVIDRSLDADAEESPVGVQQISILYRMARLLRNTDGLHPSTSGPKAGQLLVELRRLDCGRYDRDVINGKDSK